MKIKSSDYLLSSKPYLKELIGILSREYPFCSVLATDCYAKRYTVSARGINSTEDEMFSKKGFILRVKDETGYAEYSFNRIDQESIPEIVKAVREELMNFGKTLPDGCGKMERPFPSEEETVFTGATDYEILPEDLGDEAIIAHLAKIREKGKALDSRIIDCSTFCNYCITHKLYLSPKKDLEQNLMWTCGGIFSMALRGEEMKNCYKGYSLLGGFELLKEMENNVEEVVKTTLELLESEPMTPGEYECVCSPEVTGMIVHEAFGHGVEMDMFVKDRALAKSYIGEYVASPMVTMHDGAAVAKDAGTYFFDDEGVMAKDTVIIEKGILKTGICDLLSAQSLGVDSTGNGRRESYERKAYTRMTNTWFEGGSDSVEDMIASIRYGFLLENPFSGMEDPKNWGIQCMVNIAREIRDGKLTGKIFSPIVLTGYVPDLLKSISMMSPAVNLEGGGACGKGYKEWVKVSDGGPYMKAKIRLG